MTSRTPRIQYLDALRGYAILGVIVAHVAQLATLPPPLAHLAQQGAQGVQLFFVTSAIALCSTWFGRGDGAWRFYVRRLFRIAPMFWLAIPVFLLIAGTGPSYWAPNGIGWYEVAMTALFLHGLDPRSINSVVPGGWTIGVEMLFYAFFPLLILWARSFRAAAGLTILAAIVGIALRPLISGAWQSVLPANEHDLTLNYMTIWLPGQLVCFLAGIAVYWAAREYPISKPQWQHQIALVLLAVGGVGLSWLPDLRHPAIAYFFAGAAYLLSQGVGRWLVTKPMIWIGRISFSAYLWHFALLIAFQWISPFLQWPIAERGLPFFVGVLATIFALTFAGAYLTWRFVEEPGIRLGKWLTRSTPNGLGHDLPDLHEARKDTAELPRPTGTVERNG